MSEVSKKWSHLASINGDARALIILSSDEPGYCEVVGEIIKKDHAAIIVAAVNSYPSRQRLVEALQNLSYYVARISPPPYGHKCMWCEDCVTRAKSEARSALAEIREKP